MTKAVAITTSLLMIILMIFGSAFAASPVEPDPNADVQIDAAGASFPFPLIDLWRVEYGKYISKCSIELSINRQWWRCQKSHI